MRHRQSGSFIYFLRTDRPNAIPDDFVKNGCAALRGYTADVKYEDTLRGGPNGERGALATMTAIDGAPLTAPSTWERVSDDVWLGYQPNKLPRPSDLRRRSVYGGYLPTSIRLLDGNEWDVAPIFKWDSAAGSFISVSRSPQLQDVASRAIDFIKGVKFPSDQIFVDAALILSEFYFVGNAEVKALRILDDERSAFILLIAGIDVTCLPSQQRP